MVVQKLGSQSSYISGDGMHPHDSFRVEGGHMPITQFPQISLVI
jgi:hypothetical protein